MGRRIGWFGFVNYRNHPTEKNYVVFNFNSPEEADLFEKELKRSHVVFEKDEQEVSMYEGGRQVMVKTWLFAIPEGRMDEASRANGVVHSTFKKPIFSNKFLRYSLLIFFGLLIVIAVIGYVKNPPLHDTKNTQTEKDSL